MKIKSSDTKDVREIFDYMTLSYVTTVGNAPVA
jgi:hypothetical protein